VTTLWEWWIWILSSFSNCSVPSDDDFYRPTYKGQNFCCSTLHCNCWQIRVLPLYRNNSDFQQGSDHLSISGIQIQNKFLSSMHYSHFCDFTKLQQFPYFLPHPHFLLLQFPNTVSGHPWVISSSWNNYSFYINVCLYIISQDYYKNGNQLVFMFYNFYYVVYYLDNNN